MKNNFHLPIILLLVISLCASSTFASLNQRKVIRMEPDFSCYTREHDIKHSALYFFGGEKEAHIWLARYSALRAISLHFGSLPESLSFQHVSQFFRYWQRRFEKWDKLNDVEMDVLRCNLGWLDNNNDREPFLPPEANEYLLNARGKSEYINFCSFFKCLSLNAENIDDADLCLLVGIMQKNENLEELHLTDNKIKLLGHLKMLTKLKKLSAKKNEIRSLRSSENLIHLTYLNVAYNKITKVDDVSKLTCLVYLNFSHNKVKNIQVLAQLIKLKTLKMSDNEITGNVEWIRDLPELAEIRISDNPDLDEKTLNQIICEIIEKNPHFSHDLNCPKKCDMLPFEEQQI